MDLRERGRAGVPEEAEILSPEGLQDPAAPAAVLCTCGLLGSQCLKETDLSRSLSLPLCLSVSSLIHVSIYVSIIYSYVSIIYSCMFHLFRVPYACLYQSISIYVVYLCVDTYLCCLSLYLPVYAPMLCHPARVLQLGDPPDQTEGTFVRDLSEDVGSRDRPAEESHDRPSAPCSPGRAGAVSFGLRSEGARGSQPQHIRDKGRWSLSPRSVPFWSPGDGGVGGDHPHWVGSCA